MRASEALLFLAALAWACWGVGAVGEQDCDQDIEECRRAFEITSSSDQCGAYFELMQCVQGVKDAEGCVHVRNRISDRLRTIVYRNNYCANPDGQTRDGGDSLDSSKILISLTLLVALFVCHE